MDSAAFVTLRSIGMPGFQSLLNYSSSRARAAALAYATKLHGMTPERQQVFSAFILNETVRLPALVASARYDKETQMIAGLLLAIGTMAHGTHLVIPSACRRLMKLILHDQLSNFNLLMAAVGEDADGPDCLLAHYEGNWWSADPPTEPRQKVADLISFWDRQRGHLPMQRHVPAYDTVVLEELTSENLQEAHKAASSTLSLFDDEIERNRDELRRVREEIITVNNALRELEQQEQQILADAAASL